MINIVFSFCDNLRNGFVIYFWIKLINNWLFESFDIVKLIIVMIYNVIVVGKIVVNVFEIVGGIELGIFIVKFVCINL